MRIAIVGAGFTGLTAAYRLTQKNHQVSLFEKESFAGGLCAGFKQKNWSWPTERFFHHLFVSDWIAKKLITDLGLKDKLYFRRPKTAILFNGGIAQFDSPLSVLRFPYFSFPERLRTGLITAGLKSLPIWPNKRLKTAAIVLLRLYGQRPYQTLWQPLLQGKFGFQANQIAMSWFWARIKKRSTRLGYLEGGFQALVDTLVTKIKAGQGQIILSHEVKNLGDLQARFDRIVVTTPTAAFLKMAPNLPKNYQAQLKKLKMLGAINLLLILKKQFLTDDSYWLNINQKSFPFVAVVEHTNFVDSQHYANQHLVYVGGYYPQNHRYFKINKKQIFEEWRPFLQKINPAISHQSSVISHQLFTNRFAQPVVTTGYEQLIPAFKTPLSNIFLANMQMVFPWDRGINYAIRLGEKIAQEI